MITNSSKQHQVMTAENHQNKPDVKKRKLEEVHQVLLNTNEPFSSSKNHYFLKFCKKESIKRFDDNDLQAFNDFCKSDKVFEFILYFKIS